VTFWCEAVYIIYSEVAKDENIMFWSPLYIYRGVSMWVGRGVVSVLASSARLIRSFHFVIDIYREKLSS
jgi:hypothetical protein